MSVIDAAPAKSGPQRHTYDLATGSADYTAWAGPPRRTVVVCSHPRSGSTLLGEAIYGAGGLGCPLEYLHRGFRPAFARRWQAEDLPTFVRALHRWRTDPSGVLSIKLFWRDVDEIVAESSPAQPGDGVGRPERLRRALDLLEWILPNPTFVYLTRRDRIRQAVSAFIAKETGAFRSLPDDRAVECAGPKYSYEGILGQLAAIDHDNARWRDFYASDIHPYRVEYEDLAADYNATVTGLLAYLGRPGPVPASRLRRQADAASELFVARFLRDHQPATRHQPRGSSES